MRKTLFIYLFLGVLSSVGFTQNNRTEVSLGLGFKDYEFSAILPSGYCIEKSMYFVENKYVYSNKAFVYFTRNNYSPNFKYLEKSLTDSAFAFRMDVWYEPTDSVEYIVSEGKDFWGRYWKDICFVFRDSDRESIRLKRKHSRDPNYRRFSIGYSKVRKKEKQLFDDILDSFTFNKIQKPQ